MINSKRAIKQLKTIQKLLPDKNLRLAAEWDENWKILISTILSAQTRDTTTIEVSYKLYAKYSTPEKLGNAKLRDIEKIIRTINYCKTKAKNIKNTSKIISKKGIPHFIEGLLELPGVGRKVANVYLVTAFNGEAIGVDTHVGRISRKLGWTKNKNPHKIEKDLEKLFPKKYWNSINWILVRFGRSFTKKQEDEIFASIIHKIT
ncbi:MAG: endonuclease III domain-containing protein [Nanoarchaeota archaeon]